MTHPQPSVTGLSRDQLDHLIRRLKGRGGEPGAASIPRRPPESGPPPLSPDQERLWFLHRLDPASPAYNLGAVLHLRGALEPRALARGLRDLARRHPVLRGRVETGADGEPLQVPPPPGEGSRLPRVDLGRLPSSTAGAEAKRLARDHARRPFDLGRGPLVRVTLLSLGSPGSNGGVGEPAHDLLLSVHHLAGDGWSIGVFFEDLRALYDAALGARPAELPELPVSYGDYAAWQRQRVSSGAYDASLAYWRQRLAGAPVAEMPADRSGSTAASGRGVRFPVALDRALVDRLRALAAAEGATLYAALVAGFALLLGRYTGEDDVALGAVVAGRTRPEVARLVGFFANTLVLRTGLSGAGDFRELLRRASGAVVEALRHQDVPFALVSDALSGPAGDGATALFRTMLSMDARPAGPVRLGAARGEIEEVPTGTAKFDLAVHLVERDGEVAGALELSLDRFDRSTGRRFWSHYHRLLAAAVEDPEGRPELLVSWSPAERHAVLHDWGRGEVPAAATAPLSFLDRVRGHAAARPDAVAVEQGGERLSYGELLARAARLGAALRAAGVGAEDRVAVLLDEPFGWVEAFLGVQAAGAVYLPLDATQPAPRLAALAAEARPLAVVSRGPAGGLPGLEELPAVDLGVLGGAAAEEEPPGPEPDPAGLAYLLYTSGSTGRPKGVAVTRRGLANLAAAQARRLGLGSSDRVLQFAPLVFDASISELAATLAAGATLILARREERTPGPGLAARLEELRVTALKLPPSSLALVGGPGDDSGSSWPPLPDLRRLAVAGEPCPPALADAWAASRRMLNVYGPTECTVTATLGTLAPGEPVTLGRPLDALGALVTDRDLLPLPAGVAGELCVSGPGVARGYLGRPAATAERFVPDPLAAAPVGGRLYRTGDRVRWRADGRLQYLGRIDRQVKVRGVRIEPGEVEAALLRLPGVREAAVDAVADAAGDMRLVCWVTAGTEAGLQGAAVRERAGEVLPPYLVPSVVQVLAELPRTPSGKVDRRRLRELQAPERPARAVSSAPETPAQARLAEIFAELLGAPSVGLEDDFFELGGHSLTSVRLAGRIRAVFGVELPLRRIFELRTVAALAAELPDLSAAAGPRPEVSPRPARDPGEAAGPFPLSHAQERLWLLAELDPGAATYNVAGAVRLRGSLRAAALAAGLTEVLRRHQVLRATFAGSDDGPVQRVGPATPVPLPVIDLGAVGDRSRAEEVRWSRHLARRPLDLARGPLLQAALLRRGARENLLLLTMHHVVSDGWSLGILVGELREIYGARLRGVAPELPDLPLQYPELAVLERQELTDERLEELLSYWRGRLAAPPALELPLDRPRPAAWSGRGAEVPAVLDSELTRAVRKLAEEEGATPFMVLVAAFQVLLGRFSGQSDVAVGFPVANRERPEAEGLIGFFVNTLPLRTDLALEPRFRGLLRKVRGTVLEALQRQALPFQRLVTELAPDRDLSRPPLVQALFSLQNAARVEMALPEVDGELVPVETGTAKFELTLDLAERSDRLAGVVEYATDLFDRTTAIRLAECYGRLLSAVTERPDAALTELDLWSAAERHQVLVEWGDGGGLPPGPATTLHEGFVACARRSPDAVAVEARWGTLSYGELDRRSAALAARVRVLQVGPEARVGVCLERTPELVVALLGVLRAGAAYVPLDPAYPEERIAFMLDDGACRALVTDDSLAARLSGRGPLPPVVTVDPDRAEPETGPADATGGAPVSPSDLAYVIYTSGSTGRPKGVAIEHRSAAALLAWARTVFPAADRAGVLASTSVCFDLSVFELFLPLTTGGRVLLAADGLDLSTLAAAGAVTLVNTVPSVMAELVRMAALPPSVRTVNLAGEVLQGELVRRVLACGSDPRVLNLYGPSEDTTYSTWSVVGAADLAAGREPDIGRPLAGTRVRVLDARGRPVPRGAVGELHLGGAGLSRGYLGRPGPTASRYVPDRHARTPGARLYRTGDLARHRPTGRLDFVGRIDHQVKVRGFRIELGEIEATLAAHPAVEAGAALVQGEGGAARVDAVVELRSDRPDAVADLWRFLRERLPASMVPAAVTVVDALPRTPNGKLDRRALASQVRAAPGTRPPVPLAGPLEQAVARAFREVLGLSAVGAADDFFELGGHSLLATRLVSRLGRDLALRISPRQVFELRTVRALAAAIGQGRTERAVPPLLPLADGAARYRGVPLSFAQARLWFLDRLDPGSSEYNLPCALWVRGRFDPRALARALSQVVRRHEALRTRFLEAEDGPLQVVVPPPPPGLPRVDLSALPEERRAAEAVRAAASDARRPFDLASGLLARGLLVVTASESALLVLTLHHVAADGWSLQVLLDDLAALYPALVAGEPPTLPPLEVQYADFASWQRGWLRGGLFEAQRAYWRAQLGSLQALSLPTDRPRAAIRSRLPAGRLPLSLPASLRQDVERLAGRSGATPFMVLLAAFQAVLSRYAGQTDVAVGSPVANRAAPETEVLVGLFVNTLVLRSDLSGAPSFEELLSRVRATSVAAQAHQDFPFELLVEELAPERTAGRNPLFDVLLVLHNDPFRAELPGLRLEPEELVTGPAKFDLGLALYPVSDGFGGVLEYRRDLFDAATAERFRRHFEAFLAAAVAAPERRLAALSALSPAERHQVSVEWAAAPGSLPGLSRPPLQRRVAEIARRRPDALAVESEAGAVTYGELWRRVRSAAWALRSRGVGPEVPVAMLVERSVEAIVALLAILEAGGVCLPIDPSYPDERVALAVADCRPRVVLTSRRLAGRARRLRLDAAARERAGVPEVLELTAGAAATEEPVPVPELDPPPAGCGAYVIYTSGSTGRPKGVVVSREVAEERFHHLAVSYGCSPADRSLVFNALGFDVAMEELFTGLGAGAVLCVWSAREFSGHDLGRFLRSRRVTVCNLPTAAWAQWLSEAAEAGDARLEDLRLAVVGGEAMPPEAARSFVEEAAPRARLLNGYGPTEAVVTATVHAVGAAPAGPDGVPIGRPLGGGLARVGCRRLEPVAAGVPGELLLGGVELARGYLGDPRRTARSFVPDAHGGGGPGGRLYRTGDLARWRPDGTLAFLGRIDRQVKLRGFRVEPGEVEAALAKHPAVRESVVEVRRGADGSDRLVAYVVPPEGTAVDPGDLREYLAARLPPYMVPASVVPLSALPLDPNQKVDRRSLPEPDAAPVDAAEDLRRRTPTEEVVAGAFRQVLGLEAVPLDRSFFELGGHSLLASRVASRLRRDLDREVPLRLLFERPTVRGLAASLDGLRDRAAAPLRRMVDAAARSAGVPLSFSQERLWFQEQYERGSVRYSIPGGLWLRGALRVPVLARSLTRIVARHEALRTRIDEQGGEARQRVVPPMPVPLPVVDLTSLPEALREPAVLALGRSQVARPFDLRRPPLLRACLARLDREEHALVVVMHHIVSDGWSVMVLAREVAVLYEAMAAGRAPELPELEVQFPDYAVWQRETLTEEVRRAELEFWRGHLEGVAPLELPGDRPRPPVRSGRGESVATVLPEDLAAGLAEYCGRSGASPFHVLMAAFQSVLTRWSGQHDFAVGTPVANRSRRELEDLVGFFVNTLVLRAQAEPRRAFGDVVRRVRATSVDGLSHPDLPLELVVEALDPERSVGRTPLFQVAFGFLNEPPVFRLPGLRVAPFEVASSTAKFDLTLNLHPEGDGIAGALELDADLFDRATGRRLWRHLETLLAGALADPGRPVAELPLLAPAERQQVVTEWAGGRSRYPRDATLPELLARQVRLRPEAVAVEAGPVALSYGELARRVRRLAARLRKLGVGPEVPVALLLDRSVEMIVATLAAVEAGGYYAPLDPDYPARRLGAMLAETGAPVLLAHRHLEARFPGLLDGSAGGFRGTVVELDDEAGRSGAADVDPAAAAVDADGLAYVMYTSGSTGRPKGVAVPHRAVARLVLEADFARLDAGQVFLQLAPTPFDAATLEIWGPLLNGGRLVLMPPGPTDFGELGRMLETRRVTTLWLTAGLFHRMVEEELPALGGLQQLLAGGDVLSPAHVRTVVRSHPGTRLINGYGPTENTTFTTCFPLGSEAEAAAPVPIGRPIADTGVAVLDRHGRPVPLGVPGELHATGDGLARGYLGRPGATAAAFVPHALAAAPGARAYRTGDLARWRRGASLEFLGRRDRQVKLRGFRIELGEVEAALAEHPAVEAAVVDVRGGGEAAKRLVAYVVASDAATAGPKFLRDHLAERVPAFMVPAAIVFLQELPLDPNGKVDRRALPDPHQETVGEAEDLRPLTRTETIVAGVFREVLDLDSVPVDRTLFELGAHSLQVARIASRLRRERGWDLPLALLFERPTVRDLAAALDGDEAGGLPLPPLAPMADEEARRRGLPLSFAQERLWLEDRYRPGSAHYSVPGGLRLSGALRPAALARALRRIVARHEALRTGIGEREEGVRQWVEPAVRVPVPVTDLSSLPAGRRESALLDLGRGLAARGFDLGRPPLLRTSLVRLAGAEHALVVVMHHVVSDGWSFTVLARELAELYRAETTGEPAGLPELPVQYPDYAVWQRTAFPEETLERELAHWRDRLAGVPPLELPSDRPRPPVRSGHGRTLRVTLPAPAARAVAELSRATDVSRFHVLMAGFQAVLARWSGQGDFGVGVPVANRTRPETEALVGFFVNTVVLRARPDLASGLGELALRVKAAAVEAVARLELPLERIVEALAPARDPGRTPLFQVAFGWLDEPARFELPGLRVEPFEVISGTAKFDLTLNLGAEGEGIGGALELASELFDVTTGRRLWAHLAALLAAGVAEPRRPVGDLPLLAAGERHQVVAEWSGRVSAYPRNATLPELLARQVRLRPEAVAVESGAGTLTYGELGRRVGRLAAGLEHRGVGPGSAVALLLERSPEMVVATLAVVAAGGFYAPIDPDYPLDRVALMLEDAGAEVILAHRHLAARLADLLDPAAGSFGRAVVFVDGEAAEGAGPGEGEPAAGVVAESPAYVMYTSGSTGRPKGVVVCHRAVARLALEADYADLGPDATLIQVAPTSFDAATLEIWGPLLTGGRLVVAPPGRLGLEELGRTLAAGRVTTLFLTSGLFHQMVEERLDDLAGVRQLLSGGDVLSPAHVRRVVEELPGVRMSNVYGPTENTTFTTHHPMGARAQVPSPVPVGRAIADSSVAVLDRRLAPVAPGLAGDLYAAGDGLATGYLHRPARTAASFVPHPLSAVPGERLYRTGDLARWRTDGTLDFLGRRDHQVKVRGFRIELGEVETAIVAHPAVKAALAVVREDSPGSKSLVAYVIPAAPGEADALEPERLPERLRAHLEALLPGYMVPSFFVPLERFPLDPNGKVDRKALPGPQAAAPAGGRVPQTPTEAAVADAFARVLGVERVSLEESFFELGGHSLLATRLASRVGKAFGVQLPLRTLFERSTVRALAAILDELRADSAPPLVPLPLGARDRGLPLSFAQERLWFLEELEGPSSRYNVPVLLGLEGALDPAAFAAALAGVVARHETLRTRFPLQGGDPVQAIAPAAVVPVPVVDLAGLPPAAARAVLSGLAAAEAARPFDLATGPLLRAALVRLAPTSHAALVNVHHIVSDGWSMGVFLRDLGALYRSRRVGEPAALPELPVQYADFAVWQRSWLAGEVLEGQLAYWRDALAGLPVLELSADRPVPAVRRRPGAAVPVALGPALGTGVAELARRHEATPFMVLLALFQALLGRLAGQDDLAVGSPIANRTRTEVEGLIGFFVNTLVLRASLAEDPSTDELVARTRERALEAYARQDVPFERLVEELAPQRDLAHSPLFQVLFILQNAPLEAVELPGLELRPEPVATGSAKFDLTLALAGTSDGGFSGSLELDLDLFDETTGRRLARSFIELLAAAVEAPERRLSRLALMPRGERHQVLVEWNASRVPAPTAPRLHEGFLVRARRSPDAVALVARGETVSYGELERRSGALAARLRALGVGPEVRVGVCLERTPRLPAALLGVLRAGGAYVPLDPAYPGERIAFMLEDGGCRVLVTESGLRDRLPAPSGEGDPEVLELDRLEPAGADRQGTDAGLAAPASLAYVIYTSGSTGRPKGVAIEHRSACALLAWARTVFPPRELAGVLASTSVCFDLSVFELFLPLSEGGRVILAADALELATLPAAGAVSLVNTVPSAMAELARAGALPPSVATVNLAGEPLQGELVRRVHASAPGVERVLNLYGPSEDTTYSTWADASSEAIAGAGEPTVGRPVAGTGAWLLDGRGEPVPPGVPGELHLGGAGLSRGYLGRPALTADRYRPAPGGGPSDRLYRTGDLARLLPDGRLDFLGRADRQVKLRGFRIELGEVEAALAAQPGVSAAAVLVRGEGSDATLTAFVEAAEAGAGEELRARLRERLPAYMVPERVVFLDALPLTPNGKVDRRALAAQVLEPVVRAATYAPPRTPVEELLAVAFAEVLEVERVGVHDGFFELGGHSLKAARLAARLREVLATEVPLRLVFERPTVSGLADAVAGLDAAGTAPAPPLRPRPRPDGTAPLSHSQERLWILDRIEPGSSAYGMPTAVRLRGWVDLRALRRALGRVVARHESLRTTFATVAGRPVQRIGPATTPPLPVVDLAGLSEVRRGAALDSALAAASARAFDLGRGPLLRALVALEADDRRVLHVTAHHIVSDGWSLGVLIEETAECYRAELEERPPRLSELPVQYADYAHWQREALTGEARARQLGYWRERLAGAPAGLELPLDRPRPAVRTFVGGQSSRRLEPELTAALRRLATAERSTLFMVLLAGFTLLLRRLSGEEDVVVGTPVAGRGRREVEGLIGMFLNTLVLRCDLAGDPDFRELVGRVRETALGAYAHQDVPFEMLLDELRPDRDLSRTPFFQVFFNMLELPLGERLELPGAELEPVPVPDAQAKFDLTLYLQPRDGGVALHAVFNARLFDQASVDRFLAQYAALLKQAVEDPARRVSQWTLPSAGLEAVLPDPRAPLGRTWHGAVHDAVARGAREHPERVAVADRGRAWSYAALERECRRVAVRLAAAGVARGDRVAIYSHRSAPLVAAVVGVLEAGGAFVVLDPAYPAERLVEMLEVARPAALLALPEAGAVPPEVVAALPAVPLVTVPAAPSAEEPGAAPEAAAAVGPDDPAYVAFTSGSTGRPKGILGRHGSLTHFLPWQCRRFGLEAADRFSVLSGLAHDPLHRDLFTPLWLGATAVVPEAADLGAAGRLARWLDRERVSVSLLTPAMAQVVTERVPGADEVRAQALRRVFLVGDVLTLRDVERLRRLAPGVTCVNLYGSTETQRAVAFHELPPAAARTGEPAAGPGRQVLPLGRGMEDVQLLVLSPAGGLCAVGEVGEVCVRSPHVALGYLGDPELTARRFVPNPATGDPDDPVYRTGDLGRYLPDGSVAYLGRSDDQVKVRGFRIELGEVQAHLAAAPGVREAVVLLKTDGPGGRRLVGCVVPDPEGARPTPAGLRSFLQGRLPAYMVPAGFAVVDAMPLTPNRKVDRRALARIEDSSREVRMGSKAPETEAERTIAGIVREVLELDTMGVEDNFFELGGNSLLLVQVHGRLEAAFGRTIPMVALFNHPTVRSLAAHVADPGAGSRAGAAAERDRSDELKKGRARLQQRRRRAR